MVRRLWGECSGGEGLVWGDIAVGWQYLLSILSILGWFGGELEGEKKGKTIVDLMR